MQVVAQSRTAALPPLRLQARPNAAAYVASSDAEREADAILSKGLSVTNDTDTFRSAEDTTGSWGWGKAGWLLRRVSTISHRLYATAASTTGASPFA